MEREKEFPEKLVGMIDENFHEITDDYIIKRREDRSIDSEKTLKNHPYVDEDFANLVRELEGWTVELVEQDGEHHTDGCVVYYTLSFKNKEGDEWALNTSFSLMIGIDLKIEDFHYVGKSDT